MLLERLVMRNFKRFQDQEIRFQDGITGIIGNNGTGKSSIVEGILFALYGLSGTGIRPEFIVSSFAPPGEQCEVRLEIQVRGTSYTVIRTYRKGTSPQHEVRLFMGEKLLAHGVTAVEREMNRILGMDAVDLKNTIYAGQRDLAALLESRPGERKEWFSRALGIDYLKEESLALLRQRIEQVERSRERLEGELASLRNLLEGENLPKVQLDITTYSEALEEHARTLARLNREGEERTMALDRVREETAKYSQLSERMAGLFREREGLKKRGRTLEGEIQRLSATAEEYEQLVGIESAYRSLKDQYEMARIQKAEYDRLSQEIHFCQEEERRVSRRIAAIEQKRRVLTDRIKQRDALLTGVRDEAGCPAEEEMISWIQRRGAVLIRRIGAVQEAMEQLARERETLLSNRESIKSAGPEGTCPLCHQTLGEHYPFLEQEYDEQLQTILSRAEQCCGELEELEEEHNRITGLRPRIEKIQAMEGLHTQQEDLVTEYREQEGEAGRIREQIHLASTARENISFDQGSFQTLEKQVREAEQTYERFQTLGRTIAPLPVLRRQYQSCVSEHAEKEEEIKRLTSELEEARCDPEELVRFQQALNETGQQITVVEREHARDAQRLQTTKETLVRLEQMAVRVQEGEEQLHSLSEQVRLLKLTRSTIGEFVVYLMQVVRAQIEQSASGILTEITGSRYEHVLLDADFNIRVNDMDGDYPIERFSGGEQDDIAVALRIALSHYLAELHQVHDSTFLIFDEIFGSQDEERRNNLIRALRTQESRFPQIILISHIPEIQGEFTNTLVVEMGGDQVSTVREAGG